MAARGRQRRRSSGRRRTCVVRLLGALAAIVLLAAPARAASDPAFAGTGTVVLDLGGDDAASAVALDGRGRVVIGAASRAADRHEIVVTALAAHGTVEQSFGDGGSVRVAVGAGAQIAALAAAGDGIVAAGWAAGALDAPLVLRVSPEGIPAPDFAARARAALGAPGGARVLAVAPAGDGRVVVAGTLRDGDDERAFVARLLSDGGADPSFGDGGRAVPKGAGDDAAALAVATDPRGRIVIAGRDGAGAFVARLARDGALDPAFAVDGVARVSFGAPAHVVAAAVDADGGAVFVAAGSAAGAPARLARTRPDGVVDATFARRGDAALARDGAGLRPRSVALDPAGGRVVVSGVVVRPDGEHATLVRLLADGTPDAAFGTDGVLDATLATRADVGAALAVQPDGRVVAAGAFAAGAGRDLAVARFADAVGRCGDGVRAADEACDHGAANGGPGSCCSAGCTVRAAGTACRAAAGACDDAELCDGTSDACPEDRFARAGAPCRAAAGACDVAEACSGTSPECPANDVRTRGTVCRVASGACDLDEECDGVSGECPADGKRTGECRASRGGCDPAEWCDGASGDCPADVRLPDGSACDDGDACTANDLCAGDVCRGGPRDDLACTGWLCAQVRQRRRVDGRAPRPRTLRELGLDVREIEAGRAVCLPAVTAHADEDADAQTVAQEGGGADVHAADEADGRTAYLTYAVTPGRGSRGADRPPRLVSATVEDRFGVLEVTPRQVERVSLPAAVGAPEASRAPAGTSYQCQVLGRPEAAPGGPREVAVRVVGESSSERFALGRARRLCYPAGVAAASVDDPDSTDALVCYELRRLVTEAPRTMPVPFVAVNRFESLLVGALGARQLCVPAVLLGAAWHDPEPRPTPRKQRRPARERRPDRAPRPHADGSPATP